MMTELTSLNIRLNSLAIFRSLLEDPVISALREYLNSLPLYSTAASVAKYAAFVASLYESGNRTLAGHVQHIVNNDENAYIRMIGRGA